VLPLISIGIPTFNRGKLISRAIESALGQDYGNIEVVISDNCSRDETESICREYATRDSRVKYVRQQMNRGPTQNFVATLMASAGEAFMWLADDDWIDPAYVRVCAGVLLNDTENALVGGLALFYNEKFFDRPGRRIELSYDIAVWRVLRYYARVSDNSIFYGLMRTPDALRNLLPNAIGGDWLLVGALAYKGKVRTLTEVRLHRDDGGTSADLRRTAKIMGLPETSGRYPYLSVAAAAWRQITWGRGLYREVPAMTRVLLGTAVFLQILVSKALVNRASSLVVRVLKALMGDGNYRAAREWIRQGIPRNRS
jgi:glycosyltransferase involved in cell wall biosynthesis